MWVVSLEMVQSKEILFQSVLFVEEKMAPESGTNAEAANACT
jgi:hypothetical protein